MLQRDISRESRIRKLIRTIYEEEYFSFMNCNGLPRFQINFDQKNPRISMMIIPKVKGEDYILKTNISFTEIMQNNARSLLFHEFTHIYDRELLLEECSWGEKGLLLGLYTEFHATIIQMKIAIGFQSESENTSFTSSAMINDAFDEMSFLDYITRDWEDNFAFFKRWLEDGCPISRIECLLDQTMYLSAKLFFAKRYGTTPFNYLGTFHFSDIFGDSYSKLLNIFESGIINKGTMFEALQYTIDMKKHCLKKYVR